MTAHDLLNDLRTSLPEQLDPAALSQAQELLNDLEALLSGTDSLPSEPAVPEAPPWPLDYDRFLANFLAAEIVLAKDLLKKALPALNGHPATRHIQDALDHLADRTPPTLRRLLEGLPNPDGPPLDRNQPPIPDNPDLALAVHRWKQLADVQISLHKAARENPPQNALDYIRVTLDILSSELPSALPEASVCVSGAFQDTDLTSSTLLVS